MNSLNQIYDTVPFSGDEELFIPSEALKIDGKYLEGLIDGYQTLTVDGRESIDQDLDVAAKLFLPGDEYFGRRQKSRTITIKFRLKASSAVELQSKIDKLKGLVSFEDKQISFEDDPNKSYIATLKTFEDPPPGKLTVVGSFTLYCKDPRKLAVITQPVTFRKISNYQYEVEINNQGTVPVAVDYRIKLKKESGYIGIVSEYGAMEFGNPTEVDGEHYQASKTLLNTSDFSEFQTVHTANAENGNKATNGTLQVAQLNGCNFLRIKDFGNGISYKGGMFEHNFSEGAKNWYCYFNEVFWAGLMGQTAASAINIVGANNILIASYIVEKFDASGNLAYATFRVGDGTAGVTPGRLWMQIPFTSSHLDQDNPFNMLRGHSDFLKEEDQIHFYWWGSRKVLRVPELRDVEAKKMQIYIGQYANRNTVAGSDDMVTHVGYRNVLFNKNNVTFYKDVPNRYPAGSEIIVSGKEGRFYRDGMKMPQEEVWGTDYFKVPPGKTKVQLIVSSFSEIESATAEIREAWY